MLKAKEDLLVIAAQQGNQQALVFLCRYYQDSLQRYAFKISHDSQIALDAVQDAWIRITKTLRRLEDPRAFKSWIFKTVRWCVLDALRKANRAESLLDNAEDIELVEQTEQSSNARSDDLLMLIDDLPDIDRQAVYLFYLEELKIHEIAEVLEIPSGTVKSRLNRARKSLQAKVNL